MDNNELIRASAVLERAQKAEAFAQSQTNTKRHLFGRVKEVEGEAQLWRDRALEAEADLRSSRSDLQVMSLELTRVKEQVSMSRANEAKWRERAVTAELELRRCYKDIEQLTAERTDLKAMLADSGIRNAVLKSRLAKLLDVYASTMPALQCPTGVPGVPCGYDKGFPRRAQLEQCRHCWREHMVHELEGVQA